MAVRAFLIRNHKGQMITIQAHSAKGAKETYLRRYRPKKGTQFSLKERGVGGPDDGWTHYDVV